MFFTKGEPERHSAFGMTPSASALPVRRTRLWQAGSALEVKHYVF